MRKIDKIMLLVLFVALFGRLGERILVGGEGDSVRNPLIVQAALDVPQQAIGESLSDSIIEPSPPKANSRYTGSAFALSKDGHWATATHVTDGCKRLDLLQETSGGSFSRVRVDGWRALKDKDVAIMDSAQGEPGLVLAATLAQANDQGFFFGYPKGKASAGFAVHLGRSRMIRQNGRQRIKEISDEWAVYEMLPGKKIALGGNSGGPMLNAQCSRRSGGCGVGGVRQAWAGEHFHRTHASTTATIFQARIPAGPTPNARQLRRLRPKIASHRPGQ